MNNKGDLYNRFDTVMANIKPIEPSFDFDFKFRAALAEAVAERYKETAFETIARRTVEGLRYMLPRTPVLVRSAVTVMAVFVIGFHIYSIQPAGPTLISTEGAVAAHARVGDIIATGEGSQDMELSNKYAVRVKENSKIRIAKLTNRYGRGEAVFELLEGEMLINIDKGFRPSRFTVHTRTADAVALGTKFAVDFDSHRDDKTRVSVLEGKVRVRGSEKILMARQGVVVEAGQKTEVYIDGIPRTPERLIEEEWRQLEEVYQIGRKPRVILLVKNTPDRVRDLLKPCPIFISDRKPREIPTLVEDAVLKTAQAIKTGDRAKHVESIKTLEKIVEKHPNRKYDVQFMLYIGAYYEYLGQHKEAIGTFEKILKDYPDSPLASLAQCAIGVICEDRLHDLAGADRAYKSVLERYPNSLEAIWVEREKGL